MPDDPVMFVQLNGAVQVVAGTMLAFGTRAAPLRHWCSRPRSSRRKSPVTASGVESDPSERHRAAHSFPQEHGDARRIARRRIAAPACGSIRQLITQRWISTPSIVRMRTLGCPDAAAIITSGRRPTEPRGPRRIACTSTSPALSHYGVLGRTFACDRIQRRWRGPLALTVPLVSHLPCSPGSTLATALNPVADAVSRRVLELHMECVDARLAAVVDDRAARRRLAAAGVDGAAVIFTSFLADFDDEQPRSQCQHADDTAAPSRLVLVEMIMG